MSSEKREAADRLHSAAIHLLRRVREVDASAMGVSAARASALSVLVFGGSKSLSALAAAERVTPATMSRLVAAMEEEGLVQRRPDGADARAVELRATPRARRILERGRASRLDVLEQLLDEAADHEVEALRVAAEVVERALRSA
jgi:DNA-binding MarR family transcriptional regulator